MHFRMQNLNMQNGLLDILISWKNKVIECVIKFYKMIWMKSEKWRKIILLFSAQRKEYWWIDSSSIK